MRKRRFMSHFSIYMSLTSGTPVAILIYNLQVCNNEGHIRPTNCHLVMALQIQWITPLDVRIIHPLSFQLLWCEVDHLFTIIVSSSEGVRLEGVMFALIPP